MLADFDGSASQVEGNINAVEAVTRSCLYYGVRVATDPTIPANGGCYRPVRLDAPAGSIVNASPPAAVAAGNVETSQRIADVVLGALAQAAPDRVPAAGQGTMNNVLVGNDDFAYYETIAGGQGGRPGRPGQSGIHTGMTNTKNTPIESLESHYPFRVITYTLRHGSGGAGRYPGGDGIEREIEFLAPATVSLMGERQGRAAVGSRRWRAGGLRRGLADPGGRHPGAVARQDHLRRPARRPAARADARRWRLGCGVVQIAPLRFRHSRGLRDVPDGCDGRRRPQQMPGGHRRATRMHHRG